MKHPVLITIIVVLAIAVLAILIFHPEWIEKAWLWVIGLAGTVAAFFKRLLNTFTGGDKIKDIDKENEEIKKQIQDLQDKIDATNVRMDAERKLYEKDIELLNQKIQLKDLEIRLEEEKRKSIENMNWKDYYNNLPNEEKTKIRNAEDANTIDIN
jgi:cell division protein FtsB